MVAAGGATQRGNMVEGQQLGQPHGPLLPGVTVETSRCQETSYSHVAEMDSN